MTQRHKMLSEQTLETIAGLIDDKVKKISVIIRHSDRFFSDDPHLEPFMELTDDGKKFAFEFGTKLALSPLPKLYSSFLGRCIETAYLIDKGFTQKYGTNVEHNCVNDMLAPFYVLNIKKTVQKLQKEGNNLFLRNWFNNRIDEKIMENPEKTSDRLARFMIDRIKLLEENQIAICVSHDWSIYPLKEFKLGLKHESAGDVGYLDGILFFEKQNRYYITNYQTSPVQLK